MAKKKKSFLSDSVYNSLKWVCLIGLPAVATLWFTIAKIWNLPYISEIQATLTAIDVFLGAILGISTIQYNKEIEE